MNKKHHKTIKILNKIKVLFHRIFTNKLFKDSINIIITSIIATLIATIIIDNNNKKHTDFALKEKMLYDLQTICIGCNKDWMDAAFGTPVFTNKENSIIEEIYITEIAIIRAFFGAKDNACKMFFITQTSQELIPFIPTINNSYFNITGKEKKLGILSYKEINDIDIELVTAYGFYTNGTGRTFYGEGYNCFSTSQHDSVVSETPSPLFYWLFSFPKFHFHLYFSVTFTTF